MKKRLCLILISYLLLTLLMTWPTASQFNTAIPGDGFDGWQNYWNQWWIKEALLNRQTHFFFTDILYPPAGASLLFHTLNFLNGLWTLPLQLNFGLTVAYNAVVFFHFTLAGFGVYLLARYTLAQVGWSGPKTMGAALGAGIIFTFSPFHMAHLLGHMQVLSLTWPPFYILWLFKTLNDWRQALKTNPQATFKVKDVFLCGLFLALTTMIDWYQTLYMLLFTAMLLAWLGWRVWWDNPESLSRLLKPVGMVSVMGLAFGFIFAPLLIPMTREAATASYMRPTFSENIVLSADLLAFITPSELHPGWGSWVQPYYQNYTTTTSERLIFAGFIPLILSGLSVWRYRKQRVVQFWGLFTLFFFTLALGPYLHIAGKIVAIGETPLPLPYLGLYKLVPFIGISRSLSRFDLMVMIGLGVLAAISLSRLSFKWQLPILALICFEFIAIPYPMSLVDTPDFFKTIAQEEETYTIAALPMNWDRPAPLLYQTVHQKGLLTAYTSRNNPLDLSWRTPVLQQWRTLQPDIIKIDLVAVSPTILHDFKVKYIVLDYYQMPPGSEREATEQWVTAALPEEQPVYQDDRLTVYQAPSPVETHPYLQLGADWGDLSDFSGEVSRQITTKATLQIIHPPQTPFQLEIKTSSPHTLTGLVILSEQGPLPLTLSVDATNASVTLPAETDHLTLETSTPLPITALKLMIDK